MMETYIPANTQADNLIKKAINGPAGNPNWSCILSVINIVDSQPIVLNNCIPSICRHLSHGNTGRKLNCLILIDALFKNAKPASLKSFQTQNLMNSLDADIVANSAELHNFLYKNMPSWVTTCRKNHVLDPKFDNWVELFCSTHFVPNLTRQIRKKLFKDLTGCVEVLMMLTECLINYGDGSDKDKGKLLDEIVANSEEIARRLLDLQPTIVDKQLSAAIAITRDLCDKGIKANLAIRKRTPVNFDALIALANKAKTVVTEMSKPLPKPVKQTRVPPKLQQQQQQQQQQQIGDITDAEFFEKLLQLKSGTKSGNNAQQQNDLLSLSINTSADTTVNPFTSASPQTNGQTIVSDSLIDF